MITENKQVPLNGRHRFALAAALLLAMPLGASAQVAGEKSGTVSDAIVATSPKEITEIIREPGSPLMTVYTTASDRNEDAYMMVEQMPLFGGEDVSRFIPWVMSNVRYPEKAGTEGIAGRVIASFTIEKNGTLSTVEILSSPDASFSDEVVNVLLSSPDWTPGSHNGEPARVKVTIPVVFELTEPVTEQPPATDTKIELSPAMKKLEEFLNSKNRNGGPIVRIVSDKPGDSKIISAENINMPEFRGGDLAVFHQWVSARLDYPMEAMEQNMAGTVIVSFIIDTDGKLSDINVINSRYRLLSEEVVRVVSMSPKWAPGTASGEPVRFMFTMPVQFNLE